MITPMPGEQDTCSCGARILWTRTVPNNALRPVDLEPNAEGQTAVYRDEAGRLRSRQLNRERPRPEAAETLFMTHHATCKAPRQTPRRSGTPPRRTPATQRRGWQRPGWYA